MTTELLVGFLLLSGSSAFFTLTMMVTQASYLFNFKAEWETRAGKAGIFGTAILSGLLVLLGSLAHEWGHWKMAQYWGHTTHLVTTRIGFAIEPLTDYMTWPPIEQLTTAAAGPIISTLIAVPALAALKFTKGHAKLHALVTVQAVLNSVGMIGGVLWISRDSLHVIHGISRLMQIPVPVVNVTVFLLSIGITGGSLYWIRKNYYSY